MQGTKICGKLTIMPFNVVIAIVQVFFLLVNKTSFEFVYWSNLFPIITLYVDYKGVYDIGL